MNPLILDQPVVAVLGPVPVDHLVAAIVSQQGEVHLQNVGARLDDLQDAVSLLHLLLPGGPHVLHVEINEIVLGENTGFVEEILDHLEEPRILS